MNTHSNDHHGHLHIQKSSVWVHGLRGPFEIEVLGIVYKKRLQSLEFGAIVFPDAPKGKPFLPSTISNGNLDGDLYLACWDDTILQQLFEYHSDWCCMVPALPETERSVNELEHSGKSTGKTWFQNAQAIMCDTSGASEVGMLVAKLYKHSEKCTDDSPDGMDDNDAGAFATAYEDALLYAKHGSPIRLPTHLHTKLPEKLRKYVTC